MTEGFKDEAERAELLAQAKAEAAAQVARREAEAARKRDCLRLTPEEFKARLDEVNHMAAADATGNQVSAGSVEPKRKQEGEQVDCLTMSPAEFKKHLDKTNKGTQDKWTI